MSKNKKLHGNNAKIENKNIIPSNITNPIVSDTKKTKNHNNDILAQRGRKFSEENKK